MTSGSTILSNMSAETLTNVDNTISGAGSIGDQDLTLQNDQYGVIDANGASPLTLNTGSNAITNAGLIEATSGGTLDLDSNVTNTGGTIKAAGAGSIVNLNNVTIAGGALSTGDLTDTTNGLIEVGSGTSILDGSTHAVSVAGYIQVNTGATLELIGTVDNTGVIDIDGQALPPPTFGSLVIDGPVTLNGSGTVMLDGSSDHIVGMPVSGGTLNNYNTISGAGSIGDMVNALTLHNETGGVIEAINGTLTIHTGAATFVNDGTLEAGSGGTLVVDDAITGGSGSAIIAGGTLEIGAGATDSQGVAFSGTGTLKLDDLTSFTGAVSGFAVGDVIDLANLASTSVNSVSWDGTTLKVNGNATGFQPASSSVSTGDTFGFKSDGASGTELVVLQQVETAASTSDASGVEGSPIALHFTDALTGVGNSANLTSFVISGIPADAKVYDGNGNLLSVTDNTVTLDQFALAHGGLTGLNITTQHDTSLALSAVATASDGNGYEYTIPVTEAVTVTPASPVLGGTTADTVNQGAPVTLGATDTAAFTDDTLSTVTITGLGNDFSNFNSGAGTFTPGTGAGSTGTWTGTAAQFNALTFNAGAAGTYDLSISATTTGATAPTTGSYTLTVDGPTANNVAITNAAAPTGPSWSYDPENGHYYRFVSTSVDFSSAQSDAATDGVYIANVTNGAENVFVAKLANGATPWIGGESTQDTGTATENAATFYWLNGPEAGMQFTYASWNNDSQPPGGGEPTGFPVPDGNIEGVQVGSNGEWNDVPASWQNVGYVEEFGGVSGQVAFTENTATDLATSVLLASDTETGSGKTLTVSAVGSAAHGTVTLNGDIITYHPDLDYSGAASFSYTITDGTYSSTGTVTFNVAAVATLEWSGSTGIWDTTNWTPINATDSTPTGLDDATINETGSGPYTVTIDGTDSAVTLTVDSANAMVVDSGSLTLTGGLEINAGIFNLQGGSLQAQSIDVTSGATFSGYGTVTGPVAVNGTVEASGGILDFQGFVTGTATFMIAAGATLEFDSPTSTGPMVSFASASSGTLLLGQATTFQGEISGFSGSDVLDLRNFTDSSSDNAVSAQSNDTFGTSAVYNSTSNTTLLTVTDQTISDSTFVTLAGDYSSKTWSVASDGHGGVNVALSVPPPTLTTLFDFNYSDGANPVAAFVADPHGDLFSTAVDGGAGLGDVYEIINNGTAAAPSYADSATVLGSFGNSSNNSNGYAPFDSLVADANGNLFGTTNGGGAASIGTVFEFKNSGTVAAPSYTGITTLASLNGTDGYNSYAGIYVDANGNLFGEGLTGGAAGYNDGTIFEIANSGTVANPIYNTSVSTLVSFNGDDGANPYASLIGDAKGDLFGTTNVGGAGNKGTVFELVNTGTAAAPVYGSTPTVLVSFTGTNGSNPDSILTTDSKGDLFGTTWSGGGAANDGTVFEIVNTGTVADPIYASTPTTLFSFNGTNGSHPEWGALLVDANGDLFGTATSGGTGSDGIVFEIVNTGTVANPVYGSTLVTLAAFNGSNGANPYAISANTNGNLFGTTEYGGGSGNYGTAFEITNSGYVVYPPTANNESYYIPASSPYTTSTIVFNDTAPSPDSFSVTAISNGSVTTTNVVNGALEVAGQYGELYVYPAAVNGGNAGDLKYVPNSNLILNPGQTDTDSFTYTITDPVTGLSATASATFTLSDSDNYTGTSDGSWSTSSNWMFGVPGSISNVPYIDTAYIGPNTTVDLATTVTGVALTLDNGAELSMDGATYAGGSLLGSLGGTVDITGNALSTFDGSSSQVFNQAAVTIELGAMLDLAGTIQNAGSITVDANAHLEVGSDLILTGGGVIGLSDTDTSIITSDSSGAPETMTLQNNEIVGAGHLGDGNLSIVVDAQSEIAANLSGELYIDTGSGTLTNHGVIVSNGPGGLYIAGAVTSDATLQADDGLFEIHGAVTGNGYANISGGTLQFDAASDAAVTFTAAPTTGTAAVGTLVLGDAADFTGTVTGFSPGDTIDLAHVSSSAISFSSGAAALDVNFAGHSIALLGNYTAGDFSLVDDGQHGTNLVFNAPVIETDQFTLTPGVDAHGIATTTIGGLSVSDSTSTTGFTMDATTAGSALGTTVSPASGSGDLNGVSAALYSGITYDPGSTPPVSDDVSVTVTDGNGASSSVNFVFNLTQASNVSLTGTAGNDVIFGTGYNDTLTGGGGQDQFVFAPNSTSVQHTITDFSTLLDKIDLHQFSSIGSLSDLTEAQQGSDTLITLDNHDTVLLKNVAATSLTANDFLFHPGSV